MTILLFDLDGVLVKPRGYHRALQTTVSRFARLLGFQNDVELSDDDIAAFEAAGVTCEWDSAAMSIALLLREQMRHFPRAGMPDFPEQCLIQRHNSPAPDFQAFVRALQEECRDSRTPLLAAEAVIRRTSQEFSAEQIDRMLQVLRDARDVQKSLVHRVFQELVIGAELFGEIYGFSCGSCSRGFLLEFDQPCLSTETRRGLQDWLQAGAHRAAILTSRPSMLPGGGKPVADEAALGAQVAGVADLPIAGWGGMVALGAMVQQDPEKLVKPGAAHALLALQLGLGASLEQALARTAAFLHAGETGESWSLLNGAMAVVFEDAAGGVHSLHAAKDLLRRAGISLQTQAFGIAEHSMKQEALRAAGARTCATIDEALGVVLGYG